MELNEKVRHATVLEELLLRLLAILIHSISDQFEINGCTFDDPSDVLLLVVVRKHDREDGGSELEELGDVHWRVCLGCVVGEGSWALCSAP